MIKICVVCANNSGLTPSPSLPNSNAKESLEATLYATAFSSAVP